MLELFLRLERFTSRIALIAAVVMLIISVMLGFYQVLLHERGDRLLQEDVVFHDPAAVSVEAGEVVEDEFSVGLGDLDGLLSSLGGGLLGSAENWVH